MKTAVVTGAGRGMGREIARRLAARGYGVLAGDLNAEAARETAELLGELVRPMAISATLDLAGAWRGLGKAPLKGKGSIVEPASLQLVPL